MSQAHPNEMYFYFITALLNSLLFSAVVSTFGVGGRKIKIFDVFLSEL